MMERRIGCMMCKTNFIHNSNHQIANHSTTILYTGLEWLLYLSYTGENAVVFCFCLFVCLLTICLLLFVCMLFVCLFVCWLVCWLVCLYVHLVLEVQQAPRTLMEEMYWVMMSAVLAPGWSSRHSNLPINTKLHNGEWKQHCSNGNKKTLRHNCTVSAIKSLFYSATVFQHNC